MAEILGRGGNIASEALNCSAPDTGNMGTVVHAQAADTFPHVLFRGFGTVWNSRATEEMACPTFKWRDSFFICYDGEIWWVISRGEIFVTLYNLRITLVASSDATNIKTSITRESNEIVINGHKWLESCVVI
jgi:acyl-CoA dehydrogenase